MLTPARDSGQAADTGTATHLAIDQWHKGTGEAKALETMRLSLPEFPKANLEEAEKMFSCYAKDPRNAPEVVIATEQKLHFTLPPHALDPTQLPIYLEGTCDQIRKNPYHGLPELWDIKTGKPDGWTMLHDYAAQLAAYSTGAKVLFPNVTCGGIIRTRGYIKRGAEDPATSPGGIFFESSMSQLDCELILYHVRLKVALIRRGEPLYGPGEHCGFCPFGGLAECLDTGNKLGLKVLVT